MTLRPHSATLLTCLVLCLSVPVAWAASQQANRVEIDRTDYPLAKCNDDTQATYYVRGAGLAGEVVGRKWLIFLHGGGSCSSDESCAERWYDPDGGPDGIIGFHGNMTASGGSTMNFNGEGVLDGDGVDGVDSAVQGGSNPFAGFNRINVPYCSSDTWSGRNTAARAVNFAALLGTTVTISDETVTLGNPANLPPLSSIRFAGAHIVDAVVDLVMNGGIRSGRKTGRNADTLVQPPSTAEDEVVLSGSSAGGSGVIRNLDNVARLVHDRAAGVKVYGIIDGTSDVGILPDAELTGDSRHAAAVYWGATSVDEVDASCQVAHPIATSHRCFDPTIVLRNFVETPHFVVQQAYDAVAHGGQKQFFAGQLALQGVPASLAESLAGQAIRNRVSLGARELGGGVADPQHIGWFIPNYETPKHQLIVEDIWFFNSPLAYTTYGGNDPRLGTDARSTMGIPRSLACFRFKVTGQGSGCVDAGDAKVVNTTYPTNPLSASFDLATSTLTLPAVRLSNNTYFKNVVVTLNPLGSVAVNDPGVGGPGSLNEYSIADNVLKLPFVTVGGTTYERVKVSHPGLRVLSYEELRP